MKYLRESLFYIFLILLIALLIQWTLQKNAPPIKGYDELMADIANEKITSIEIEENKALVELKSQEEKDNTYVVYIPDRTVFMENIDVSKFEFKFIPEPKAPWWLSLLPIFMAIAFIILLWFFVIQPAQSGGGSRVMSFGKSRAKLSIDDKKKISFKDVAGADEEKEDLMEIVEFLKDSKKFIEIGARIPKGVLIVGPPGTGKTLLAKAISGEAKVPFFSISGSDFVEMFVGVGASRVRDLFEQAKKNSPSIVFIDEIDAVGRHRGAGLGGGHDEREQTLNQLLVEMDGFGINEGVIIIAATNRPDILDPALLRPGRFDRRISIGLPDIKGREEILKVHSKNKPLNDDVDLVDLAKTTPGFTGADLENLLNEAALLSARRDKSKIGMEEIKEATFKVVVGPEKKSRVLSEKEKKVTAYHEAGHALTVKLVSTIAKVDRISIIPSGLAEGYTIFKPDEDLRNYTKSQLMESIMVALGGRAAEELSLGEISTGASNDLKNANNTARNMITRYGMSDNLGNLVFDNDSNEVFVGRDIGHTRNFSEQVAAQIDDEVKMIIDKAYQKVTDVLKENKKKLEAIAKRLLEKEKIEGAEFEELFSGT